MAVDAQTVLEVFDSSLFLPLLASRDRDAVLAEFVGRVAQSGIVRDPALLLEMLRNRERLGSTGIGHGVAVPHGRSLAVRRLVAGFGRHPKGVDWDAADGLPVQLVFFVLAPPVEQPSRYLPFLGRIVEAVSDADRRNRLHAVTRYDEFLETLRGALS